MSKQTVTTICFFVIVVLLAYSSNFSGRMLLDDATYTTDSQYIQWTEYSIDNLKELKYAVGFSSRPITIFSFAALYPIFNGSLFSYHIFSILLHAGVGLGLFVVTKQLIKLDSYKLVTKKNCALVALFSSMIWLIHPLNSQAVNYIIQRSVLFSSFFYIWGIFYFIKLRECFNEKKENRVDLLIYGFIVLGLFILAMGSKSIAITFPFVCLLIEFMFFQKLTSKKFFALLSVVALTVVSLYFLLSIWRGDMFEFVNRNYNFSEGDISRYEHFLTGCRAVFVYLSHFFWTDINQLRLEYSFPISQSLFEPITTLFSLIGLVAMVLFSFLRFYKNRLLAFATLFFLGNMVLETFIIKLDLIYEHRSYLPSMFLCLLIVPLFFKASPSKYKLAICCLGVFTIFFGGLTFCRSKLWAKPMKLYEANMELSPNHQRLLINYFGTILDNWKLGMKLPLDKEEATKLEALLIQISNLRTEKYYLYSDRLMIFYILQSKLDLADKYLKISLSGADSKRFVYHTERFICYCRLSGFYEEAEQKCWTLFNYSNHNSLYAVELVNLKLIQDDVKGAFELSSELATEYDYPPSFFKKIGDMLLEKGSYTEAKLFLSKYLSLDPADERVSELLKVLP